LVHSTQIVFTTTTATTFCIEQLSLDNFTAY